MGKNFKQVIFVVLFSIILITLIKGCSTNVSPTPKPDVLPPIVFEPQIIINEEFNFSKIPKGVGGNYWYAINGINPNQTLESYFPGDGFAYIQVDADVSNDIKPAGAYQTVTYGMIGPGHRLEVKMKGAVVDGGLVSFIFTYNEFDGKFNETDIELVADDTSAEPNNHNTLPAGNGWTDTRLNTWRNADVNSSLPGTFTSKPITDASNNSISHIDDAFHTYTIDWLDYRINYYIDDVLQTTHTENIATGNSEVIIGFRNLTWDGDFRWQGTKTMIIDYFKIETLGLQPSAKFSAVKKEINKGESITFYDQSPTATSWEWEFTGGIPATSTKKDPVVTYQDTGNYSVTLKVANDMGIRINTQKNYIKVN